MRQGELLHAHLGMAYSKSGLFATGNLLSRSDGTPARPCDPVWAGEAAEPGRRLIGRNATEQPVRKRAHRPYIRIINIMELE